MIASTLFVFNMFFQIKRTPWSPGTRCSRFCCCCENPEIWLVICSEGNLSHLSEEDRVGLPDMVEHLQDGGGDVPPADLLVEDVVRHEGKAANSSLWLFCTSFPSTGAGSGR